MQVHLMSSDGTSDIVGVFPNQPTYKELEIAVKEVNLVASVCYFPYLASMYEGLGSPT